MGRFALILAEGHTPEYDSFSVPVNGLSRRRDGPGETGSDSNSCDSAVRGTNTPELACETGKSVLIRPCTLAVPWGADSSDVVAPAITASGGNSAPNAPAIWISPVDSIANERPRAPKVDIGLASVQIRKARRAAEFHLPGQRLDQIDADRALSGQQLPLGLEPAPALASAAGPTWLP